MRSSIAMRSVAFFAAVVVMACGGSDDGTSLNQDGRNDVPNLDAPDGTVDPDVDPADTTVDPDVDPADTTVDPDVDPADTTVNPDADPADTTTGDTGPTGPACPLYQKLCDGVCVNTSVDPAHCGDCDFTCTAPEVCSAGGCSADCLSGLTACDGTCVDLETDSDYCGSCTNPCPDGQGCVSGTCRPSVTIGEPETCDDFGPIVVTVGGADICLGDQAQTAFTWGVCSCGGIATTNEVVTDAYDSTLGPWAPGGTGGGIGLNGDFSATNKLDIGGTLWASAASGSTVGNETHIAHALHVGGPFTAQNETTVGHDAYIRGNLVSGGSLAIAGVLHQPPAATVTGNATYAARVDDQPVDVPPPCRCAPDELVPVADIIAAHTTQNDNAVVGLDAGALVNPGGDTHLALPCGRYYLDAISTSNKLTVIATGRTALFIGGDVSSSNELQVTVAPGAELDLFIGGTLNASNKLRLGSANFPAMMRVYLGGTSGMTLSNNVLVGAYLYVGHGPVSLSNQTEVFGGLFVKSLNATNKVTVHYDRAILGVGYECEPPPPGETCSGCSDCGNQACVDGTCGACAASADCCAPLVCVEGQCLSLGIILD